MYLHYKVVMGKSNWEDFYIMKSKRIDIRVPLGLLEKIEKYQKEMDIATRTGAMLDLVRIGLKCVEEDENKKSSKK
jgi:hypothetical protein